MTAPKPRLRDVEARAAAATEGPWGVVKRQGNSGYTPQYGVGSAMFENATDVVYARSDRQGFGNGSRERDATFIAASRTDVPALTAAIRAVLEEAGGCDTLARVHEGVPHVATAYRLAARSIREALSAHIDLEEL